MNGLTRFRHMLAMAVGVMCFLLLTQLPAQAAQPATWKDTGFSIDADGMTLGEVLRAFGKAYAVRPDIAIRDDNRLRGRIKGDTGAAFLDRLAQTHRFQWFVYNQTLYVVPRDDNASLRLEVGEDAVQDAKSALIGLGLYDSRFGWGELPDEGTVVVSGPRAYVNLARDLLMPEQEKSKPKGKQVMLFRLKYASATDRVINVRNRSETIPGVKTILSSLLLGPKKLGKMAGSDEFDANSRKRSRTAARGRGEAIDLERRGDWRGAADRDYRNPDERAEDNGMSASSEPKKDGSRDGPRIEADPTLNAIMIYDDASKRQMYQELINQLDVEPQQIEIEALIVDLDRSKLGEMGVEWGVRDGNTVTRVNGTSGESRGVELPLPGSTLLISNAARFYARLRALEEKGEARVLAKPTVLTLDNVAAVLDLSQTAYLPLVGERVADLADVTAGTTLRVVPRIVPDGAKTRVRLEVDVEDGALGSPAGGTSVTRSTISTQAIIDMHQTLMIGGYHTESIARNEQKVPVLGDVPVFGNLFRSTTDSESTRERLFLITPRLVGTTGTRASERSRTRNSAQDIAQAEALATTSAQRLHAPPPDAQDAPASTQPAAPAPTPVTPRSNSLVFQRNAALPPWVERANSSANSSANPRTGKRQCARPRGEALAAG